MLTAIFAGTTLFFAFTAAMLCQERLYLINRAREAEAAQIRAEKDALLVICENERLCVKVRALTESLNHVGPRPTPDYFQEAVRRARLN